MKCPDCKSWASVLETRDRQDGTTYRRYECANLHRFTTHEVSEISPSKQPRSKGAFPHAPKPI